MSFDVGEIIDYRQMCELENASLQRGMYYRLASSRSVVLMSVRSGAPYDDEIQDDGQVLIYEGHDVPRSASNPRPKLKDQQLKTSSGTLTENGHFYEAAEQFKKGQQPAEVVRVYEKIKSGIWSFAGTFELLDAWPQNDGQRRVYKFKLKLVDSFDPADSMKRKPSDLDDLAHNRIIPQWVKIAVWKRDKGKCVECGSKDNLHFDHIIPFSKGGSSVLVENIQLLCARHNFQKSDKLI